MNFNHDNFEFNSDYAKKILDGIGGKWNIKEISSCITRLRLILNNPEKVNEDLLINETGAVKVIRDNNNIQIVYGVKVDTIRKCIESEIKQEMEQEGYIGNINAKKILEGIGGKENIKEIDNCITRLRLTLNNPEKVNEDLLINKTGAVKIIRDGNNVQIVYGIKINEVRNAVDQEINK